MEKYEVKGNTFIRISYKDLMIGSNVRAVNKCGVELLKKNILQNAWSDNSVITVTQGLNGKYRIIDGAHRWTAICKLLEENHNSLDFSTMQEFTFNCMVLPTMDREDEMALAIGLKL